jgi:hypothetical protein
MTFPRPLLTSVTRRSDLAEADFQVTALPRDRWATGDFIVAEVLGLSRYPFEVACGRRVETVSGDRIVGALGKRQATLEAVGDWEAVGEDGILDALTGAGVLGKATSVSPWIAPLTPLRYLGHATRDGKTLQMAGFALPARRHRLDAPVVLIVGTSMSAGKTAAARVIVRLLAARGRRVVAAKVTGAARYSDMLGCLDAGAAAVFDFVDVGLPSSIAPPAEYGRALDVLLSNIAATRPDAVVIEAGASPLEPYNGDIAVRRLRRLTRAVVLAASDPYAVLGVQFAFRLRPHMVTGPAANTSAGVALSEKLSGARALNLLDAASEDELAAILSRRLRLGRSGPGRPVRASRAAPTRSPGDSVPARV